MELGDTRCWKNIVPHRLSFIVNYGKLLDANNYKFHQMGHPVHAMTAHAGTQAELSVFADTSNPTRLEVS